MCGGGEGGGGGQTRQQSRANAAKLHPPPLLEGRWHRYSVMLRCALCGCLRGMGGSSSDAHFALRVLAHGGLKFRIIGRSRATLALSNRLG